MSTTGRLSPYVEEGTNIGKTHSHSEHRWCFAFKQRTNCFAVERLRHTTARTIAFLTASVNKHFHLVPLVVTPTRERAYDKKAKVKSSQEQEKIFVACLGSSHHQSYPFHRERSCWRCGRRECSNIQVKVKRQEEGLYNNKRAACLGGYPN